MKFSKLTYVLFLLALLLSACQSNQPASPTPAQTYPEPPQGPTMAYPQPTQGEAYPYPQPGQGGENQAPEEIAWDQVEPLLLSGKVTKVMQTHDLKVYLTRQDGSLVVAVEPEIDAILQLLDQCGETCKYIAIATE